MTEVTLPDHDWIVDLVTEFKAALQGQLGYTKRKIVELVGPDGGPIVRYGFAHRTHHFYVRLSESGPEELITAIDETKGFTEAKRQLFGLITALEFGGEVAPATPEGLSE